MTKADTHSYSVPKTAHLTSASALPAGGKVFSALYKNICLNYHYRKSKHNKTYARNLRRKHGTNAKSVANDVNQANREIFCLD